MVVDENKKKDEIASEVPRESISSPNNRYFLRKKSFVILSLLFLFVLLTVTLFKLSNIHFRVGSLYLQPVALLPEDPCSSNNKSTLEDIKSAIQCCDDYEGFQEGYTLGEIKDECYARRIYDMKCDISFDVTQSSFEFRNKEDAEKELQYYRTEICDKMSTAAKQEGCYQDVEEMKVCVTTDVSDCADNDAFCEGVLGGEESKCLMLESVSDRYWCLHSVMRLHDKYEMHLCDGMVYEEEWENVYGWTENQVAEMREKCRLEVLKRKKDVELCKTLQNQQQINECVVNAVSEFSITDASICEMISYDEEASNMYANYDISFKGDVSLCYAEIAARLEDISICDQAEYPGSSKYCREIYAYYNSLE